MKEISVAGGHVAIVDDSDYETVSHIKWYLTYDGYVRGYIHQTHEKAGHHVRMHRYLLGLTPQDQVEVDHINGNPLDNRRNNLRICTRLQNSRNTKLSPRNTSGYRGVSFVERTGKWQARIWINRVCKTLGSFETAEDASAAYCQAAKEHFGEFARIPGEIA